MQYSALQTIYTKSLKNNDYKFAYIEHDNDIIEETGELKKPHYHVVIQFRNARTLNSLAKELKIEPNYIEFIQNLKNSLLYLIHYNHGDKYQYDINLVQGDLKTNLLALTKNITFTEEERVLKLLSIIDSYFSYTSYNKFLKDICYNGLYDIFRRNSYYFSKCLDKQNENYYTHANDSSYQSIDKNY